jgi:hypothetical protein
MAGTTGLEPATSAVTGQRSNQLSYVPRRKLEIGIGRHRSNKTLISEPLLTVQLPSPDRNRTRAGKVALCCCDMNECIRKSGPLGRLTIMQVASLHNYFLHYAGHATRLPRPAEVNPISIEMPRTHCSK